MSTLLAGLLLFLGIHSISIVAPGLRDRIAARIGTGPWKGLYALAATVGLVLVVRGFLPARAVATISARLAAGDDGAATKDKA